MRNLHKRLDALEVKAKPFVPVRCHLIGMQDGTSEADAIADYEAESGPVGPDDLRIFLVGIKPHEGAR
ncbi:hypothetical protein [Pelagerythrobacter aerophilus]|uniref:hypothetical protein n=1 Tax=Pelagerythrobacter aerophilus TaxID=2306995 RepID=UPI0011C34D36|nr:hypothetical protein [Pelagerythrobacter aerophilus]